MAWRFFKAVHILVGFAAVVLSFAPAYAAVSKENITARTEVFEDPTGKLTIDEVSASSTPFRKVNAGDINFGYRPSAIWVRVSISALTTGDDWLFEIDNARLQKVDFFARTETGWNTVEAGAATPWEKRLVKGPFPTFDVPVIEQGKTFELYARIESQTWLQFSTHLETAQWRSEHDFSRQAFLGIYYGITLALIAFNLFLFIVGRDPATLYYIFFLSCMTLMMLVLNGMAAFVFGTVPGGWPRFLYAADLLGFVAAMLFTRQYLNLPKTGKIMDGACTTLAVVSALALPVTLTDSNRSLGSLTDVLLPLVCFVCLGAGISAAFHRSRTAWFYLCSWTFLIAMAIVWEASGYGFMERSWFTENAMQIATSVQMLILATGVADHYADMRRRAMDALQKSNIDLDARVQEQTGSLRKALANLESEMEMRLATEKALKEQQLKFIVASRLAALGEMAAGIAHEINNPLQIIDGRAHQLEEMLREHHPDLCIEYQDILQSITKNALRVAKIIKSMVFFARDDSSEPFTSVPASKPVQEALSLCQEKFKSHGVRLAVDITKDTTAEIQCQQVSQIILNLLNNAFDAVEHLAEKWIDLRLECDDTQLRITVKNSGPPIPALIREKLFTPFFTTKQPNKGSGLGLGISRKIADNHRGTLELAADCAETTFVLTLPLKHEDPLSISPNVASKAA